MEHIRQVWPCLAQSGALTLKAETAAGEIYFLHSLHDPEAEAEDWLKRIKLVPNAAYLVYGFGLGYHVKKLLANLPVNSKIFVIEYSAEESLVKAALQLLPEKGWMYDKRIVYLPVSDITALAGAVVEYMRNELLSEIIICRHQPTMRLFSDFYAQMEKSLQAEIVELLSFNIAFAIKHTTPFMINCWRNLPFIAKSIGSTAFQGAFSQIPAIIVSSGPSLDKNVAWLKKFQSNDKAIIIASGSAVQALSKNDIVPHFLAIIDPSEEQAKVIENHVSPDTAMLATYGASMHVVADYPGRRVFCRSSGAGDMIQELSEYLPPVDVLPKSSSVATTAFEFACHIDANPIIFIGQDMALTEGRNHARVIDAPSYNTEDTKYLLVKGQNGQLVTTTPFLNDVRNCFVSRIRLNCKNRIIINATEGGAYLDGAVHMTLRQAQEKYLTKRIGIGKKIDNICRSFTPPDEKPLIKAVKNINELSRQALEQFDLFHERFSQENSFPLGKEQLIIGNFQKFFNDFRKNPVYPYLKFHIEALYLFQTFEHRAGRPLDEQIADWAGLFEKINQNLTLLNELSSNALIVLTKNQKH